VTALQFQHGMENSISIAKPIKVLLKPYLKGP
jgi:hypothetical protein